MALYEAITDNIKCIDILVDPQKRTVEFIFNKPLCKYKYVITQEDENVMLDFDSKDLESTRIKCQLKLKSVTNTEKAILLQFSRKEDGRSKSKFSGSLFCPFNLWGKIKKMYNRKFHPVTAIVLSE